MRFAVQRPGIPEASPRSHGVPRRDVPGRIHICVAGETAGRAYKARLALARLRIHVPACATALRSERGVNLLDPAGRLVLQSARQEAPTRPHDLPVEPGLLPYIPAGRPGGSPGRARHARDVQVLDSYRACAQGSRSISSWAGEGSRRYRDIRTYWRSPPTFPEGEGRFVPVQRPGSPCHDPGNRHVGFAQLADSLELPRRDVRFARASSARSADQAGLGRIRRPCMPPSTASTVPVVAPASGLAR